LKPRVSLLTRRFLECKVAGRTAEDRWLEATISDIGVRSSIDFSASCDAAFLEDVRFARGGALGMKGQALAISWQGHAAPTKPRLRSGELA
jgi:hypothetical protein